MPRPKLAPADSPKRQAILDAALELFAERGFHGTTIPDVAEKAKVGAGTVYRYFASKEKLVNHLYQHWKGEYGRYLMGGFEVKYDAKEMFSTVWRRMWQFYDGYPTAIHFLELHHHGSYLDKRSIAMEEALLEPLERFVQYHQHIGGLAKRPTRLLMALVYGAFLGLVHGARRRHIVISDDLLKAAEESVWRAIA